MRNGFVENNMIRNKMMKKVQEGFGIEYFLPFYPLLVQYNIGPTSLGNIGLILVALYIIVKQKYIIQIKPEYKFFVLFIVYATFRDILRMIIMANYSQTYINRIAEYVIIFLAVITACNKRFDENRLYSTWKIAGSIYILGLIFHMIQLYILGRSITPISIIPGYLLRAEETIATFRPSSFFSEPAAFVSAILPLEFLALKNKEIKWAVMVTFFALCSTSTVGIILSVVLWTCFLISSTETIKTKIGILVSAIIIITLFTNLNIFSTSLGKLLDVSSGGSTFESRIAVGFDIIKTQPIETLFFGTNYGDVFSYIAQNISKFASGSSVLVYYRANGVFLNTFSRLVFMYGWFGVFLFYLPMLKALRNSKYSAKAYIIMVIVATFAQTMLLNAAYFTMIIMVISFFDQCTKTEVEESE